MNAAPDNAQTARKMLAGASCWVLTDGKAGDDHSGIAQFYEKLAKFEARK